MIQKVSVIGLGKLGACMAACFAARGFETIGVDLNPKNVDALNRGEAPVEETDLPAMMARGRQRLRATVETAAAVLESDATFVIVPTPSDAEGKFSLQFAAASFHEIGKALKNKKGYHLVVLTSTVLPGGTQSLIPILERNSGKKCGADFGVCYSPEFIALGSVIRDFLNPDFVLIGEHDARGGEVLEQFYKKISENGAPVARMNLVNAELTKISVNSFMTMKISFANMLAVFCERLPGGDVEAVTRALGLFGGVGKKSLKGGLGYGGPCLPRDNVALSALAKSLELDLGIPAAVDVFNRSLVDRALERILKKVRGRGRVAVLGLAYKPHTWVIEESQGLELARRLVEKGFSVTVFDPQALEAAKKILQGGVAYAQSPAEAIRDAEVVVITTPDPSFENLSFDTPKKGRKKIVFDVWRLYKETLHQNPAIQYVAGGVFS